MQPKCRVFANTLPKAGTGLLATVLDELVFRRVFLVTPDTAQEIKDFDESILVGTGIPRKRSYAEIRRLFAALRYNEYAIGHLPYTEAAIKLLNEIDLKKFVMIRDPRDVAVSLSYFFTHHEYREKKYVSTLADHDAKLLTAIEGFTSEPSDGSNEFLQNIGQSLDYTTAWINEPGFLFIRFEDLIGERGGGSRLKQLQTLRAICDHLEIDLSYQELIFLTNRVFNTSATTFRNGQIGDWKNHFKTEHIAAFQACAGRQLIELGYETNDSWSRSYSGSSVLSKSVTETDNQTKFPLDNQEIEARLLTELLQRLDNKVVVDVGTEKGGFISAFLEVPAAEIYVFEPYPDYLSHLHNFFASNHAVHLSNLAVGQKDEETVLCLAQDAADQEKSSLHFLVSDQDITESCWIDSLPVQSRSLDSLVNSSQIPARTGILRMALRGSEYALIQRTEVFHSDVVMLNYWAAFPDTIPFCEWHIADMIGLMAKRGYSNFVFVKYHGEFKVVELNNAQIKAPDWGHLIFVHDNVFEQTAPALYKAANIAQAELIDKSIFFRTEAEKRLVLIQQLDVECQKRLAIIEQLDAECQKRLEVIQRLDSALTGQAGR